MMCYPLIFLIVASFMGDAELATHLGAVLEEGPKEYLSWTLLPLYPTLKSYVRVLIDTPEFFVMFWNSVKIAGGILIGQLLIATPCAWGIAQGEFRHKKRLLILYIVLMLLPFQVRMLSEYLILKQLNLLDTLSGIILPSIFSTFPVFIMFYFFKAVPREIVEAARVDGATEWWIFIRLGVPLSKSGIISAMLLGFFESWNLIEQPLLFLDNKEKWPLSIQLANIKLEQADVAVVSSVITLILPIMLFLFFQQELEEGIATSVMKE